jgi:7-cyano-7-deazaguanine synthase in queuosine biosynthesis
MADDVHDVWWREFEDLGEEQVRARLAQHIWGEDKERLARQWLELRQTSLAREANDLAKRANDLATQANDVARRNNIIATLALVVAVPLEFRSS